MRLGGVATATTALVLALDDDCILFCNEYSMDDTDNDNSTMGAIMVVGAGMFVVGVVHDIVTADDAAREYNAKHARALSVAPMIQHPARNHRRDLR